jgi:hypothetical protein
MARFTLDRKNNQIELIMSSGESHLLIRRITLIIDDPFKNHWATIIASIQLSSELKYMVNSDLEGRFLDERTLQSSIDLSINPNQIQPVFEVNHLIHNENFTLGNNPETKFYTRLTLDLKEISQIAAQYKLMLEVQKHKILTSATILD